MLVIGCLSQQESSNVRNFRAPRVIDPYEPQVILGRDIHSRASAFYGDTVLPRALLSRPFVRDWHLPRGSLYVVYTLSTTCRRSGPQKPQPRRCDMRAP